MKYSSLITPRGYGRLIHRGKLAIAVCGSLLASVAAVQAETVTIAALGDSLTQGYGLPVDQGFVTQLEDWLIGRGLDIRIVNAGVSGDTSAGGLARVGWTLTPEIDAMIVALGGNDLLRGISPAVTRENLAGILEVAKMQGVAVLLVGIPATGNYGPEFRAEFDALFTDLAGQYGVELVPDFFAGMREGDMAGMNLQYMQADGIHPNALGVAHIVDHLGPDVARLVGTLD